VNASEIRFGAILSPAHRARAAEAVASRFPPSHPPAPPDQQPMPAAKRSSGATGNGTLHGYVVLWDRLSCPLGGFRERIARGAFDQTLQAVRNREHSITIQTEHDTRNLLGRAGVNLELVPDEHGLRFTVRLPRTTLAFDTIELVRTRILTGVSFGFSEPLDSWDRSGREAIRTVKRLRLHEVSLVAFPAYSCSSVTSLRGLPQPGHWVATRLRATAAQTRVAAAAPSYVGTRTGITWR
jgi:HK97 family phage prohead protease